ncbi:RNB-domain-containing protein [Decorospora gaudefroyi]|uniref:RNB-domain-containing protein n=1 Tax=Decorospora gaudefroyi TaxID=184978 RepID=A0A6A5K086_9PLEO|nr:RNB-domain-containing protein [Decorospora gaudefroyi]
MHSLSLRASGEVCMRCQWRLFNQRANVRQIQSRRGLGSLNVPKTPRRALHAATVRSQVVSTPTGTPPTPDPVLIPRAGNVPIRKQLEQWQHQYGTPTEETLSAFGNHPERNDIQNSLSKLSSGFKADEEARASDWDSAQEDDGAELMTIGLFLKPGDVVELSQPGREPVLAVFVQQLGNDSQFFSVNGRWAHSALATVAFAIPGCIDPALLQPLVPFMPTDPSKANIKGEVHVPQDVAAPVVKMLKGMTEEAEQIYRTKASIIDTAYAVLADADRTRMMRLTQIAQRLLAPGDSTWVVPPAALLAVRKALNHNEFRFRSDIRSHRLTNTFAIRPKRDVRVIETVHEWIREYREFLALSVHNSERKSKPMYTKGARYVADFLQKARRLIANSRKHREPDYGNVGPSKTGEPGEEMSISWGEPFTDSDKQIIDFLQAWVLTGQFTNMSGLHAACASLLSATGCYGSGVIRVVGTPDDKLSYVGPATGLLFLQEIGVLSPHEDRAIYDEQLMLPTVRTSRNLELLNTKAELTRRNPDFSDSMADLRRDWGSTTIYCIDDVGAHEIDDGISIERVADSESEFWIHVHVANPTAFLDKSHTLSGLAAHMTETVYTPERAFPMLPTWATQGHFSIDRNRPIITFSSRIDGAGSVLETKIQHGIAQNVISITPSELSTLLDNHSTTNTRKLVVGGQVPKAEERPPPTVSPSQLQDLRDLFTAAQALWEARKAAGGVRFGTGNASVRLWENTNQAGMTWYPPSVERARLIRGDPIIELTNVLPESFMQYTITPKHIVEEMMMLGGRTAASWCAERNIPVIYRGTVEPPSSETLSTDELQDLVHSHFEEHGTISLELAARYTKALGRAIAHFSPLPHKIIGIPSYVKVTSPLRRFSDMIAHWQIEAAVRYEARTGMKFDALQGSSSPRNILPFSQRQIQEAIVTLSPRERIITQTKRDSKQYWATVAFLRAFKYHEAPLPEVFRYWVQHVAGSPGACKSGGRLPEYDLKASMLNVDTQVGDEWEVTLDMVDVFRRSVDVKPVRLLSRLDTLK